MHRNVTAIYRTREVAERVRAKLEDTGVPARDIHVVPDAAYAAASQPGDGSGAGMTAGMTAGITPGIAPTGTAMSAREHPLHHANLLEAGADHPAHTDRLHELHLPEDDLRTYQHAVRNGDHVVSVEVDDAAVEKVKAVMRHPETGAYDIEHRASEFRNNDLIMHSAAEGRYTLSEEMRARRLATDDGRLRTYERNRRLDLF